MATKIQRRPLFAGHKPEKGLLPQVTQHGRVVWYFRVGHGPRVRIGDDADFGSNAFVERYKAAKWGKPMALAAPAAPQTGLKPDDPNSVAWLIRAYKASKAWPKNANTARNYASLLRDFGEKNGGLRFRDLTAKAVAAIRDRYESEGNPVKANKLVITLRQMYAWAADTKSGKTALIDVNPVLTVEKITDYEEVSHHGWTESEREQFEAFYPQGSRERLAYAILFGTGQRCSDVVLMGRQHLRKGGKVLALTQVKTRKDVAIPLPVRWMRGLKDEIAAAAGVTGDLTFVVTPNGKPFNANEFSKWFSKAAKKAGLVNCTAHGLRHAASVGAVEEGYDALNLQTIFGYTLQVAETYIKKFSKEKAALRLAEEAESAA